MKTTINLRIDKCLKEQLEVVAEELETNISVILREIIIEYLFEMEYLLDNLEDYNNNVIVVDLSDYDFDSEY